MDEWRVEDGAFHTQHFSADFRAFVALRDFGFPDANVRNCFAAAALVSIDAAFVLGQMGAHTANAGRIYFPCGTPDMGDVRETPGGYGFGRAAQGLSRYFRVNPRTVNGAAEGSRVNINLRFAPPED